MKNAQIICITWLQEDIACLHFLDGYKQYKKYHTRASYKKLIN